MNFQTVDIKEVHRVSQTPQGIQVSVSNRVAEFEIIFGNRKQTFAELESTLEDSSCLKRSHQVHSSDIIYLQSGREEVGAVKADGISCNYSQLSSAARPWLCISTADCLPVFIIANGSVFALHCGWRGVASRLAGQALESLLMLHKGEDLEIAVLVGPHIGMQSFAVDEDVKSELLSSMDLSVGDPSNNKILLESILRKSDSKFYLSLSEILKRQLWEVGFRFSSAHGGSPTLRFADIKIDTHTDTDYHSYRRDKEKSGRQISYCKIR